MLILLNYLVYLEALYNLILILSSKILMLNLIIFWDQWYHMLYCHLLFCNLTVMIEHTQLMIKILLSKAKNFIGMYQAFPTVLPVVIRITNPVNVPNENQNNLITFSYYIISISLHNTIIILITLNLIILFFTMMI